MKFVRVWTSKSAAFEFIAATRFIGTGIHMVAKTKNRVTNIEFILRTTVHVAGSFGRAAIFFHTCRSISNTIYIRTQIVPLYTSKRGTFGFGNTAVLVVARRCESTAACHNWSFVECWVSTGKGIASCNMDIVLSIGLKPTRWAFYAFGTASSGLIIARRTRQTRIGMNLTGVFIKSSFRTVLAFKRVAVHKTPCS
jgi:hypothetical protein